MWELPYPHYNVDCMSQLVWHETPTTSYTEVLSYCILQQHESRHKFWWFWSPSAHRNTFPYTLVCLMQCEWQMNKDKTQILLSYEWIQFRYFPDSTEQIVVVLFKWLYQTECHNKTCNSHHYRLLKSAIISCSQLKKQWSFITTFYSSLQTSAAIKGNFTDSLDN